MNNYEYITASLPVISREASSLVPDAAEILEEIREQLSGSDRGIFELLMSSYGPDMPDAELYRRAAGCGNGFIRTFFDFDRRVRNTKVAFINRSLERPAGQDILLLGEDEEFEEDPEVRDVLEKNDLLDREKGLDALYWDFIDEQNALKVFCLDVILGFTVKLKIVDRWLRLDPGKGRELFEKLVKEIRNQI